MGFQKFKVRKDYDRDYDERREKERSMWRDKQRRMKESFPYGCGSGSKGFGRASKRG